MAERYDNRYRDRWSERDRDRNLEWDERHEQARSRGEQGYSSSPYAENRPERGDYFPNRSEPEYGRGPYRRTEYRPEAERGSGYVGRNAYVGEGAYESHVGAYNQSDNRGYGATATGATWGATDTQRHRLGSLTDSAADSARRQQYRYGQEGGGHTGRGPKNYQRSDERIMDDVCERLTRDPDVDATHIEVSVQSGLVTLGGTVTDRQSKRVAEDISNDVWGVKDVQNQIKVQRTDLLTSSDTNQQPTQTQPPVVGHSALPTTRH